MNFYISDKYKDVIKEKDLKQIINKTEDYFSEFRNEFLNETDIKQAIQTNNYSFSEIILTSYELNIFFHNNYKEDGTISYIVHLWCLSNKLDKGSSHCGGYSETINVKSLLRKKAIDEIFS
jgi:NAD+--asparagine ADP-ribosyltransferase